MGAGHEGYDGSYDAVRRYAGQWVQQKRGFASAGEAFVPLSFAPGDAYQFDWSHEQVELGGAPQKGQVENQVGYAWDNIFKPRLRFDTLVELNGWLEAECERRARLDRPLRGDQGENSATIRMRMDRVAVT